VHRSITVKFWYHYWGIRRRLREFDQNIWLKAITHTNDFNTTSSPKTWRYRIYECSHIFVVQLQFFLYPKKKKNFNSFIQYEILTHNWYISTKYYIFRNKRRYMSLVRFTMNGIFVFMIDWAFGIVQSTTIKLVVWPINTLLVYYLVIYSKKNILIVCYLLFFFTVRMTL
jgi:hypothetical protein